MYKVNLIYIRLKELGLSKSRLIVKCSDDIKVLHSYIH
jgi:hypothetical protein